MTIDVETTLGLDLPGLLAQLAACREAEAREAFWFTYGVSLSTLQRLGYRVVPEETPIAPDDRWRLALWAEREAARARWSLQPGEVDIQRWLLHLISPD